MCDVRSGRALLGEQFAEGQVLDFLPRWQSAPGDDGCRRHLAARGRTRRRGAEFFCYGLRQLLTLRGGEVGGKVDLHRPARRHPVRDRGPQPVCSW